jgi:GNAT superfamily N-acetyltransferase
MPQRLAWRVTLSPPAPDDVGRLLGLLPGWFGLPASNAAYVEAARAMPAYLARPDGEPDAPAAGVLLAARHYPGAAEVFLMAVDPDHHRRGAGRALVAALEAGLIADGAPFLQVKTQGPGYPDAGYEKTRQFYAGVGFQPLEEVHGLWPGLPCLIMIKYLGQGQPGAGAPR